MQMSLSRALVDLGDVLAPALEKVAMHPNPTPAAHACATERLLQDPSTGFDAAIDEAKRLVARGAGGTVASSEAATGADSRQAAIPATRG